MKKRFFFDHLAITICLLVFSALAFFGTNMLITIIFNYEAGWNFPIFFAFLPHFLLGLEGTTFLIFIIRYLNMDKCYRAHHARVYLIHFMIYSTLGLIMTIIGSFFYSEGFFLSNPYPGVLFVLLFVNLIVLVFSIISYTISRKKYHNPLKYKYSFSYSSRTLLWTFLLFFGLNRMGAFLAAFVEYMDYNYFLLTLPFYLSLLVPLCSVVFANVDKAMTNKPSKKIRLIVWGAIVAFSLATGIYTIIIQVINPFVLSLTSAAMPIERIASLPIDTVLLYGVNFIMPIFYLIKTALTPKEKFATNNK